MQIDIALTEVCGLISYFRKYRKTGFVDALVKTKDITCEIGIEPIFIQKCVIRRKNSLIN